MKVKKKELADNKLQ